MFGTMHFIHNGHEYTYHDSARVQFMCPHCNTTTSNKRAFSPDTPESTFLGYHSDGPHYIVCFECNTCFKKFFYHTYYKFLKPITI